MLRDGEFVVAAETRGGTRWVTLGWRAVGVAHLLMGRTEEAIAAFSEVVALTRGHRDLNHVTLTCLGYSALAAAEEGDWRRARKWARDAYALTNETGLEHIINLCPRTRPTRPCCNTMACLTRRPRRSSTCGGSSGGARDALGRGRHEPPVRGSEPRVG